MSRRTLTRAPNPHAAPPVAIATRRDLFGTMGAMLLLTAAEAGPAKAAELDGELLECCAEADVLYARASAIACVDGQMSACLMDDGFALHLQAASIPARTPEGLQAKAQIVLSRDMNGIGGEMALSLARDVLGRPRS